MFLSEASVHSGCLLQPSTHYHPPFREVHAGPSWQLRTARSAGHTHQHIHTHTLAQGLSVAYRCARSDLTLQTSFSVIMKQHRCLMMPHVLSAVAVRATWCQFQSKFFVMRIQFIISTESTLPSSLTFTYLRPWPKHCVLRNSVSPS